MKVEHFIYAVEFFMPDLVAIWIYQVMSSPAHEFSKYVISVDELFASGRVPLLKKPTEGITEGMP